jgi:hypothetical protein
VIDPEIERSTRRAQATIGALGLVLVIAFSVYLTTHGSATTPGIAAGHRLVRFVAPLATSDLDASANVDPRCDPVRPARRGLNVCDRGPIALDLFATGAAPCVRSVDALQELARRFPGIEFAAVAVGASQAQALALVRAHRWRIPVAYDSDGAVAQLYGVSVCPLIELAGAGGVVRTRLIGKAWSGEARLRVALARFAATR